MPETFDEHKKRVEAETGKLSVEDKKAQVAKLNIALQASLDMKALTSIPTWDKYLTYVQAAGERVTEELIKNTEYIFRLDVVNVDDVMKAKLAAAFNTGQQRTLEWALELPKAIIEAGKMARELKVDMMKDEEE